MLRVGLTGGLATGKSLVAAVLEELGCLVIRADELGHAALEPGGQAYAPVVAEFGPEILDPEGRIVRRRLAKIVFANPGRLARLNDMVHPVVIAREEALLAAHAAHEPDGIGVVEAAILIETGSYRRFAKLVVTVCAEEQQIERAMARDLVTREEIVARLRRQMPLAEKVPYADYVIDTSGTVEQTTEQTRAVHRSLRSVPV